MQALWGDLYFGACSPKARASINQLVFHGTERAIQRLGARLTPIPVWREVAQPGGRPVQAGTTCAATHRDRQMKMPGQFSAAENVRAAGLYIAFAMDYSWM
jgi:hypothetical protein